MSGSCTGHWAPRWQRHSETTAIKILCSKQAASRFPRCSDAVKMYFFVPFVRPCMHHKCGGISESHAWNDCVWPIILDAGFPGVQRGLKFCVCTRPAKVKPAPHLQEFEKFCPHPPRTLLTRTHPADHPNPRSPRTFSVSNPHLSENY